MLKKFVLGGMVVVAALLGNACGDDGSGDSPAGPADSEVTLSSSSDDVIPGNSSSSSVTESPSTSSGQAPQSAEPNESSSSEKAVGGSSSSDEKSSSSSGKVESSSSGKGEKSSSSERAAGSSSSKVVAGSSSSEKSSSSVAESSSSVESSSSKEPSSSSAVESSSSVVESSSSLEIESSSSIALSSSSETPTVMSIYDAEKNTLTDLRDNKVYKTVTIGTQVWMAENLNYLPEDTVGTFWAGRSICGGGEYQSLQEGDCSVYGRLYEKDINAYDHYNQNICPDGWDVPTLKQWQVLVEFLGGINVAGKAMKSNENRYWPDESLMNEYGFSAISAGYFVKSKGYNSRNDIGELRAVFTVHSFNSTEKNGIWINDKSDIVTYTNYGQGFYLSIRCIKK